MPARSLAAALGLLALAGAAAAQDLVKITSVKVGLPAGRFTSDRDDDGSAAYVAKNNTWAPVYVQLELKRETKKKAALVLEGKDADELSFALAFPLPDLSNLLPGNRVEPTELPTMPYIKLAGGKDMVVSVREVGRGDPVYWAALGEPVRVRNLRGRDVSRYVVVSLGTKLPGFDLPGSADGKTDLLGDNRALRGGRVETSAIDDVALMPDQWFGYEAADLVVLTTGATRPDFLNGLFADPNRRNKLDALLEWVRRGGKLVVSAGLNAQLVSQFETLKELLPAEINKADAATQSKELNLDWSAGGKLYRLGILQPKQGTFAVANLSPKPDAGLRSLLPGAEQTGPRVVVQSAYGLGRVTLVAIDLDRSPFTEFAERPQFWDLLLREAGSPKASLGPQKGNANANLRAGVNYGSPFGDTEDEATAAIRNHVDTFEGVPVISFGWVAVFIILYTLLIGPVEYFVLKKVFKRLELTWITFPIIVLTVSTIAYFTAYSLKGNDLKINKMDVVDVDPASGRVYGRTWFTLFSPRIENYTITVRPNEGWAAAGPQPAPLVDWTGSTKTGKESLFSRRYGYHTDADTGSVGDGLVGVPIQVWSTKSFAAEWTAKIGKDDLVKSNLVHPAADRTNVVGTFTLNLPVAELKDVRLVYAGKAYKLDAPIAPGQTVTFVRNKENEDPDWLAGMGSQVVSQPPAAGRTAGIQFTSMGLLGAMFHEAAAAGSDQPQNATLRRLDQSWRLTADNRSEVIVVGRVQPLAGSAEELTAQPQSPTPTVLWLKNLPGAGGRQPVPGTLQQETFVRVFVPVRPAR